MSPTSPSRPERRFGPAPMALLVAAVAALLLTIAGCSGDDDSAPTTTSDTSGGSSPDGAGSTGDPSPEFAEYCAAAVALSDSGPDLTEDPDEVLASLRELSQLAPGDLSADYERFVASIEKITAVQEGDPAAFSTILQILLDPQVQASLASIDETTQDECGVKIGGTDSFGAGD